MRFDLGQAWWCISLAVGALAPVLLAGCEGESTSGGGGGAGPQAEVTFHRDVEPLLQRSCLGCHFEGKIGGFSLLSYESASAMAGAIAVATEEKRMPPWGARDTESCTTRFGFVNDISLSDDEIALLRAWSDQGAPQGDPADAPPAYELPPDGLPGFDLELVPEEPGIVEGDHDLFECVVYDPALTESKWVDGIHMIPDNLKVAHHALTFRVDRSDLAELSGGAQRFPCFGGAPGDIVHVWAPGGNPFELPDDVGIKLDPDQVIVVQMHYHPTGGAAEQDASRLQLRYADSDPGYQFVVTFPGNASSAAEGLLAGPNDGGAPEFRIPANTAGHTETMEILIPAEVFVDVPILMVMTHMHYVGTDIRLDVHRATLPASQPQDECLIHTPAWDFNWQRMYTYDTPISQLPTAKAGDVLKITCHYDNTLKNPFVKGALEQMGMSAPQDVLLGEETLGEMCLAPLGILLPASLEL